MSTLLFLLMLCWVFQSIAKMKVIVFILITTSCADEINMWGTEHIPINHCIPNPCPANMPCNSVEDGFECLGSNEKIYVACGAKDFCSKGNCTVVDNVLKCQTVRESPWDEFCNAHVGFCNTTAQIVNGGCTRHLQGFECGQEKNYCEILGGNPCRYDGVCVARFGGFTCVCRHGHVGTKCQTRTTKDIRVVEEPGVAFNNYGFITSPVPIAFYGKSLGSSIEVTFVMENGRKTILVDESAFTKHPNAEIYLTSKAFIQIKKMKGPFFIFDFMYEFHEPGYTTFSVEVRNSGIVVFSTEYDMKIFPSRGGKGYAGHLKFNGAGMSVETSPNYNVDSEINVECIVWVSNCLGVFLEYHWLLEKNVSGRGFVKVPLDMEIGLRQTRITILPFKLTEGTYRINIGNKILYPMSSKGVSNVSLYFRVKLKPLVVKLAGGRFLFVKRGNPIVVDASESYDPNVPPNSQELNFSWKCFNLVETNFCDDKKGPVLHIPPEVVQQITTLIVSAIVNTSGILSCQNQTIEIRKSGATGYAKCISNCGSIVSSNLVLHLQSVCDNCLTDGITVEYEWEVSPKIPSSDTEFGFYQSDLLIKAKSLEAGRFYIFIVKDKKQIFGKVMCKVAPNLAKGDCIISQKNSSTTLDDIKSLTYVTIKCQYIFTKFDEIYEPMNYEFYQKTDGKDIYLGANEFAELKDAVLSEGKESTYDTSVCVVASDSMGRTSETCINCKVLPPSESKSIGDLLEVLDHMARDEDSELNVGLKIGNQEGTLQFIAAVSTALAEGIKNLTDNSSLWENVEEIQHALVNVINQVPLSDFNTVKQAASSLHNVLRVKKKMEDDTMMLVATAARKLAESLSNNQNKKDAGYRAVVEVSRSLTDIISSVFSNMSPKREPLSPEEAEYQDEITNYVDLEWNNRQDNHKLMMTFISKATDIIKDSVSSVITYGQTQTEFTADDMKIWVKKDVLDRLSEEFEVHNACSLQIFPSGNKSEVASMEVSLVKSNPMWWNEDYQYINAPVVMVNLIGETPSRSEANTGINSINLRFKVDQKSGSTIHGTLRVEPFENLTESSLTTHRVEVPVGSRLLINFNQLPDDVKLMVHASDARPEISDFWVNGEAITIPQKSKTEYQNMILADAVSTPYWKFFYIGILPHNETMKEYMNREIEYSFDVYSVRCLTWNDTFGQWGNENCKVSATTPTELHCHCKHLSLFSCSVCVARNKVDPMQDIYLFLQVHHNPLIVCMVSVLLLLYFCVFWWAWQADKEDKKRVNITLLEDNNPLHHYLYMITVFTGHKAGAGTSSNVAIQLEGEFGKSQVHILKDSTKSVHEKGTDSTFIMAVVSNLGDIKYLHIWHDCSGSCNSWFCDKIVVRDMQRRRTWYFLLNRWFSFVFGNGSISGSFGPATKEELESWKLTFNSKVHSDLKEQHIWFSIFARDPRSNFTRCQRLSVAVCILLCGWFSNMMFYGIPKSDAYMFEVGSFHLDGEQILIGIESSLLCIPINMLIVTLFRKSQPKPKPSPIVLATEAEAVADASPTTSVGSVVSSTMFKFLMLDMDPWEHPAQENENIYDFSQPSMVQTESILEAVEETSAKVPEENEKPSLPYWCIYIGWVLCLSTIFVDSFVLMLYGLSFGPVKSRKWLISVLTSFVQTVLIQQPLKIIALALFFSLVMKKSQAEQADPVDIQKGEGGLQEGYYYQRIKELESQRAQGMYLPMPEAIKQVLERRGKTEKMIIQLLTDMLIYVIFITALMYIVHGHRESSVLSTLNILKDITFEGRCGDGEAFEDVNSKDSMYLYLEQTLMPSIYKKEWYNGDKLKKTGWICDMNNYLVGIPRIKQSRVKPETCWQQLLRGNGTCSGEYNFFSADKDKYSPIWTDYDSLHSGNDDSKLFSPWEYRTASQLLELSVTGFIAHYAGGGYVAPLGKTSSLTEKILQYLSAKKWIDERTRALFMQFIVYNANVNYFIELSLQWEWSATGYTAIDATFRMLKLESRKADNVYTAACVFFVMILCLYIFNEYRKMRYLKLRKYFSTLWNILDVILIMVTIVIIILYISNLFEMHRLMDHIGEREGFHYVSFSRALHSEYQLNTLTSVLLCLATVKVVKMFSLHFDFRKFTHSIFLVEISMTTVVFPFIITLLAFGSFAYFEFHHEIYEFRGLYESIVTLLVLLIQGEIEFQTVIEAVHFFGPLFFVVFTFIVVVYWVTLFEILSVESLHETEQDPSVKKDSFDIIKFVTENFMYKVVRKKPAEDLDVELEEGLSRPEKESLYGVYRLRMEAMDFVVMDLLKKTTDRKASTLLSNEKVLGMCCLTLSYQGKKDLLTKANVKMLE